MKKIYIVFGALALAGFAGLGASAQTVDTTAPSAIANLAVSSTTAYSVTLTWTAPGNDGSVGTSTSYDLRYFTSVISESNWASSTLVSGEPTPKVAGSSETMIVTGLASSTHYFFAIKSKDAANNESVLSNVVSATTPAPPAPAPAPGAELNFEINVTPESLNLASHGNWVTVHLFLSAPYKANNVDFTSLKLNNVFSPEGTIAGIDDFSNVKSHKGKSASSNLVLKFARANVQSLVGATSASSTTLTLTLTGKVSGKTFTASDTIYVFKKVDIDNDNDDDEGELVQATSSPEVYVIRNGHKRHIPSPKAFARLGLRWENIKKVSEQILNSFSDDELLRASNSPDVYLIIAGFKRRILSPQIFESYGFSWSDITVVSPQDLADYLDATLVRAAGDERVYLLAGGQKHWVPSQMIFNKKGFKWDQVFIINLTESNAITTGSNVQ